MEQTKLNKDRGFLDKQRLSEEEKTWFELIKSRIYKTLGREVQPETKELPAISIEILLTPHETAEDWKSFHEALDRADVCIVETQGWSEDYLKFIQKLSRGNPFTYINEKLKKRVMGNYDDRDKVLIETIYNSKKPVTFIDLPKGHPLIVNESSDEFILQGTFENILGQLGAALKLDAGYQRQREDYMIASLKIKIGELVKEFPELRKKNKIRLLITIGSAHVNLFTSIKKEVTPSVERNYGNKPAGYDSDTKALMRYMLDKEVSDELLARILLGHLTDLRLYTRKLTTSNNKAGLFENKIVSYFSLEEIRDFFEELSRLPAEKGNQQFARELLFSKLSEKGIKPPETEDKLDDFLKLPSLSAKIQDP